ncbi:hypothetical protein [Kocuria rosea]|uniref:hypothetical protein n=1 Tax=Kocuria rosea TaxID=1275 RepID=UPI00119E3937|nr:hypothetical protein [Kocuria rosea]
MTTSAKSAKSTHAGNSADSADSADTTSAPDTARVEHMLKLAKTKAELIELVRSLDNRNVQLQNVIRRMTTKEHQ